MSLYDMRKPCRFCAHALGRLERRGGQNCVFCAGCGRLAYNAPKTETGEAVASLASRPDIKPSKRARIFERDNYTCVGCHAGDRPLVVGHFLSVADGRKLGASDEELFDDSNLLSLCGECNAGQGSRTMSTRLMYRVLVVRAKWERAREAEERKAAEERKRQEGDA